MKTVFSCLLQVGCGTIEARGPIGMSGKKWVCVYVCVGWREGIEMCCDGKVKGPKGWEKQ